MDDKTIQAIKLLWSMVTIVKCDIKEYWHCGGNFCELNGIDSCPHWKFCHYADKLEKLLKEK